MNNGIIIVFLAVFLLFSFFCLALIEKNQSDIEKQDLWFLYFFEPKGQAIDFVIENHSNQTDFHWEASSGDFRSAGDIQVKKGSLSKITLSESDFTGEKVLIRVVNGERKKEIYKIFKK